MGGNLLLGCRKLFGSFYLAADASFEFIVPHSPSSPFPRHCLAYLSNPNQMGVGSGWALGASEACGESIMNIPTNQPDPNQNQNEEPNGTILDTSAGSL